KELDIHVHEAAGGQTDGTTVAAATAARSRNCHTSDNGLDKNVSKESVRRALVGHCDGATIAGVYAVGTERERVGASDQKSRTNKGNGPALEVAARSCISVQPD